MQIIIMAHKKEAASFFHQNPFKVYPFTFKGVYIHPDQNTILLICGNGPYQSLLKVTALLNHLKEKGQAVKKIINLGLAGGLLPSMKICQIFQVSKIFANNASQSFSLDLMPTLPEVPQESCLSNSTPTINKEQVSHLNHQAGLVDMELWSIAYACSFYKIKLRSFKLVSDLPCTHETDTSQIMKDSYNMSETLYIFFKEHLDGL